MVNTTTPYNGSLDLGSGILNAKNALDAVNPELPPVAEFSGAPLSGDAPLQVQFTDLTSNAPTSWYWDFGDSGTSTAQHPNHTYTAAGVYTVTLTATNAYGTDDEIKTDYITVTANPPVADFSADPTSGTEPLTVQFTDLSSGAPTQWSWDFGDSGTSTAQHPSHTYNAAGSYTVTLTATNAHGYDEEIKVDYITVTEQGHSVYAFALSDIPALGVVNGSYLNTAANDDIYEAITEVAYSGHPRKTYSILEHSWNFNVTGSSPITCYLMAYRPDNSDGDDFLFEYSTDNSVFYSLFTVNSTTEQLYTASLPASATGEIWVRVTDTNHTWRKTSNDTIYIDYLMIESTVSAAPPVADFSAEPTNGYAPLPVQFTDLSSNAPFSWDWSFGDGGTSTAQHPNYTYDLPGTYTVTLTATNAYGNGVETKTDYITVTEFQGQGMHVADMVVTRRVTGPHVRGRCVVTIVDDGATPVANATVYATATGPVGGDLDGVTGSDGTVTLETNKIRNPSGEWCFEVTNVTHATNTYMPGDNVVTVSCESDRMNGAGGDAADTIPLEFNLEQNYPNPFNPVTEIAFTLPEAGFTKLEIYNAMGVNVASLVSSQMSAGRHVVAWNASSYATGVYLYRLTANGRSATRKLMLIK